VTKRNKTLDQKPIYLFPADSFLTGIELLAFILSLKFWKSVISLLLKLT